MFGLKSVGSAASAFIQGTVTMAATTAIAVKTAVRTIHPSLEIFLNLLIVSSSNDVNVYKLFCTAVSFR